MVAALAVVTALAAGGASSPRVWRVVTVVVLTIALIVFVSSKSVSSRFLKVFPVYAPIVKRLPKYSHDTGDPTYLHVGQRSGAQVDTEAIRRAGRLLPDGATYYVDVPDSAPNAPDIGLAAGLFFQPSLRSRRPELAGWALAYGWPPRTPGVVAAKRFPVGENLVLVKLRKR